jgi:uncharacterized cupin superfamily protein
MAAPGKQVSEELGRKPQSTDLNERHPFDVEIARVPPGKIHSPYHSHSAQWEFYHVISGTGLVRHKDGTTQIETWRRIYLQARRSARAFQQWFTGFVLYVVADNPIGESCYYPDSKKWLVRSPERRIIRSDSIDYYDGEE